MSGFVHEIQEIILNGVSYSRENILSHSKRFDFSDEVFIFLAEWFNDSDFVTVQSSGSTGAPKLMQIQKKRMIASAKMTCSFLGLRPKDTALLCMPVRYIAGKMLIIRALVAGLNLITVEPSSNPLGDFAQAPHDTEITFAAMIPMQVQESLKEPAQAKCLKNIKQLIIGGAPIDDTLATALKDFPHHVYSTYGMTETLSHIALRRLNKNPSEWYTPFENVNISLSDDNTLIINAPMLCEDILHTNDIACIKHDNNSLQFRILGRKDNCINSGGIKILIEEVEQKLKAIFSEDFAITSKKDTRLGEKIILLLQGDNIKRQGETEEILRKCAKSLPPYWAPKDIIFLKALPYTETGKINRAKAKELATKL